MPVACRLLLVLVLCQAAVSAHGQSPDEAGVVERATELSNAGNFSDVVVLLAPHVEQHPEDVEGWLLLAQHCYWTQDFARARHTYERALHHHPTRTDVRVAYARFLLENGDSKAARRILRPVSPDVAEAEVLRGTMAWWSGDLTRAQRAFERALTLHPAHPEAAPAVASIRAGARPWIRVSGQAGDDSQPLNRSGATAEAGLFVTPLQTVKLEASRTRFALPGAVAPMTLASATYGAYAPAARLELELSGGVASRRDSMTFAGHVETGFRMPFGLLAGVRWDRAPYLYTLSSISESVVVTAVQAHVALNKTGWIAEAAIRHEAFPDANSKRIVYGWLMAPLFNTETITFQAGYAYGYQNTAEHRFTPVRTGAPNPRRPPTWEGRYMPYYTPLNHHVHSAVASVLLRPLSAVALGANGSFGFYGLEDAPYVYLVGQAPATGIYSQVIRPWNVKATIAAEVSSSISLQLEVGRMTTTWYDASSANLSVYARF